MLIFIYIWLKASLLNFRKYELQSLISLYVMYLLYQISTKALKSHFS